jgi:hypothetical protein
MYNGKLRWLGYFDTAQEAHAAFVNAAIRIYGPYAPAQ